MPKSLCALLLCLGLLHGCTTAQPGAEAPAPAGTLAGRAVKIVDGDTFDLLVETPEGKRTVRIRLDGIDCPERGQDFGTVAKDGLGSLLMDKSLRFTPLDTDRYGRVVGDVHTTSGTWVNEALVREGLAWHYVAYSSSARLAAAEKEARAAKAGLWSAPRPVAPWEWRKEKRTKKKVPAK